MGSDKIKILFLCTTNSHRSQMAEGWVRHLKSDCLEAYSAGIVPAELDPVAVKVMAEVGVDISRQSTKKVYDMQVIYNYIFWVSSNAVESCPMFPGSASVTFISFNDPFKMAATVDTVDEKLNCYRRVRDQIKALIQTFPGALEKH